MDNQENEIIRDENGLITKGPGRPPGSANKITKELREGLHSIRVNQEAEFLKRLNRLEDVDYCKVYIEICRLLNPKSDVVVNQETNIQNNVTNELPVIFSPQRGIRTGN